MENQKELELKLAKEEDFETVRDFYFTLIDQMRDAEYRPKWEKEVYPSSQYLREHIEKKELYYVTVDGLCAAAMIMNHDCPDGYFQVKWNTEAKSGEFSVIHTLGVLPSHHGSGLAAFMVKEAIRMAEKNGQKAVRLDVLSGNLPAVQLYESMGFEYRDTMPLYYEDTGKVMFYLYEYVI